LYLESGLKLKYDHLTGKWRGYRLDDRSLTVIF